MSVSNKSGLVMMQIILVFQLSILVFRIFGVPVIAPEDEYLYLKKTDSSYKLYPLFTNLEEAENTCASEEAVLFDPENKFESDAVQELWNDTVIFRWKFYNNETEAEKQKFGNFEARPVWELYNSGQPIDQSVNSSQASVIILRNNYQLATKFPFICKKTHRPVETKTVEKSVNAKADWFKGYTFLNETQHYYKIHTYFKNWEDAKQTCAKENATLFYPENKCECDALLALWDQKFYFRQIFIGISSVNESFYTIDGRPILDVYSNWNVGEPNNALHREGCVVLMRNGTYNDERCSLNVPFACQKKYIDRAGGAVCDKTETYPIPAKKFRRDYKYIKDTRSHYKIHTRPHNITDAKQVCSSEGASLFFPENQDEANAVIQLWKQIEPTTTQVLIGVLRKDSKTFKTLDDRDIEDVYNKWRPGEPSNSGKKEDCVLLYLDGTLNDDGCYTEVPFICKKIDDSKSDIVINNEPLKDISQIVPGIILDYKFVNETQSAYKVHPTCSSWENARRACEQEGATLFYPADQCEARAVLKKSHLCLTYRWIFASSDVSPSKEMFKNVACRPIWELYNTWDPAEIKNQTGKVEMPYLLLNNLSVVTSYPFVCKKILSTSKQIPSGKCDEHKKDVNEGYIYFNSTENLYKIHTDFKTWKNANETCVEEGAVLYYPGNGCEAKTILDYWIKRHYFRRIYIGVSSLRNGTFETVDGRPSWEAYYTWRRGEPDNSYGNEGCVAFVRDGTLNDVRCSLTLPFICKKIPANRTGEAICDKVEEETYLFRKDYTYIENTDSVYKIHTVARRWEEAVNMCESEGTELFFPANECEMKSVLNFWQKSQDINEVFVGISSKGVGNFKSLDGRNLWEIYYKFGPGEPNNLNGEENCLILGRQLVTYNDDRCDVRHPFICQKKLNILSNKSFCEMSQIKNEDESPRNDYKYIEDTESYYKIHTILRNWLNAKQTCVEEGAELFFPENECEANVVRNWWNETQLYAKVFIGVSSPYEGIYNTIDGRPLQEVYSNWNREEDSNDSYKNCVLFDKDDGELYKARCDQKNSFICKKIIDAPKKNATCTTKPENLNSSKSSEDDVSGRFKTYTLLPETNNYYKLHLTYNTWEEAKVTCIGENASLYFPENECENEAVINFYKKSNSGEVYMFVGISSFVDGSQLETIDGREATDVYKKWNPGEPNNADGVEGCAVMSLQGTLNDEPCDGKKPFICKKTNEIKAGAPCNKQEHYEELSSEFFRSDYTYAPQTKHFYKIHTSTESWYNAKKKCAREEAQLFYPENEVEKDLVLNLWNQTMQPVPHFFVGISDILAEGDFETIDGRPILDVYNSWGPGEPNDANDNEDCVLLRTDGTLNDDVCDKRFPFICKKDLASLEWNENCNIADKNYIYNKTLGKCYKFHLTPKNWTDAYAVCSSEQSYLTVIDSTAEADYLVKFTNTYARKASYKGQYLSGAVHVGYHNRDKKGWKTVKGQPLFLTGYDKWDANQPDGADEELCGSMFFTGTLNDLSCSQKCFFICERDVNRAASLEY